MADEEKNETNQPEEKKPKVSEVDISRADRRALRARATEISQARYYTEYGDEIINGLDKFEEVAERVADINETFSPRQTRTVFDNAHPQSAQSQANTGSRAIFL